MRLSRGQSLLLLLMLTCCEWSCCSEVRGTRKSMSTEIRQLKKSKGSKTGRESKERRQKSKGSKKSKGKSKSSESTETTEDSREYDDSSEPNSQPSPTKRPVRYPTAEPSLSPSVNPANLPLATGNIFDLEDDDDQDPGKAGDELSTVPDKLEKARHVIANVSVAIERSLSPSALSLEVAKVTTSVVRSYTPFLVYMLDGNRQRQLQSADLMYDPKESSFELAYRGSDVSWWKYQVAYQVIKEPEEEEEALGIDEMTEAAVVNSIQSGLFFQLLATMERDALGVAVPGAELHSVVQVPTGRPTDVEKTTDSAKRNRSVWVAVGLFSVVVICTIIFAFVASNRRRRRRVEETWTITLGEQKERGEILNAEWNSAYCGESGLPSETMGAFSLTPQDYAPTFCWWEQATADGTEEATAQDTSFTATDGS